MAAPNITWGLGATRVVGSQWGNQCRWHLWLTWGLSSHIALLDKDARRVGRDGARGEVRRRRPPQGGGMHDQGADERGEAQDAHGGEGDA